MPELEPRVREAREHLAMTRKLVETPGWAIDVMEREMEREELLVLTGPMRSEEERELKVKEPKEWKAPVYEGTTTVSEVD